MEHWRAERLPDAGGIWAWTYMDDEEESGCDRGTH
jgi:hypothetical protein